MAYKPTGKPRGRPLLFDRPQTGAERVAKHRYWKRIMDRGDGRRRLLWEKLDPDALGHQLAVSLFDFRYKRSNRNRWEAISASVLKALAELECEIS